MNAPAILQGAQAMVLLMEKANPANALNKWIFERVKSFVAGRVLEVKSNAEGLANYCVRQNIVAEMLTSNLSDDSFFDTKSNMLGAFETLFCLNIRHQVESLVSIANCAKLLKQNGYMVTLLPASTALYNNLTQGLNYWVDSNQEFINRILLIDFKIIKNRYFVLSHKSNELSDNNKSSTSKQENLFYKRIPIFYNEEESGLPTGLFILTICQKRTDEI